MCFMYIFVILCLVVFSLNSVSGEVAPTQGGSAWHRGRRGSRFWVRTLESWVMAGAERITHGSKGTQPSLAQCRDAGSQGETCNLAGFPEEVSMKVKRSGWGQEAIREEHKGGPRNREDACSGTQQRASLTRRENGAGGG